MNFNSAVILLALKEVEYIAEMKRHIDEIIREALDEAPAIQGYTIRELAEITERPWSTIRWHLESLNQQID